MAYLQEVSIIGRLTRDPELRYTPRGTAVMDISVAVNRTYQQDGEWKNDPAVFWTIRVWGKAAENMAEREMHRGDLVFARGDMRAPRLYEKRDGSTGCELSLDFAHVITLKRAQETVGDFQAAPEETSESPLL